MIAMANRTELFVHLVWATRQRLSLVDNDVAGNLYALIAERCRALGCVPIAIGGMLDHVHLLASLHPTVSVAQLAKEVKGSSSHLMRTVLRKGLFFQWQSGYGAFTVADSGVPGLRHYIANQAVHHQKGPAIAGYEPPQI